MVKKIEYVFFNTEITDKTSTALLQELQEIAMEKKEPRIVLCCFGGGTTSAFLLHDQIKLHWPDIVIIGSGTMQSAAADLFFSAKKKNRYVTEHCSMLIHEMYCKKKGKKVRFSKRFNQLSKESQKEFIIERNFGHDIFEKGTGLSKKEIVKLERKGTWLTPEKIVKSGFASKVIKSLDEIG